MRESPKTRNSVNDPTFLSCFALPRWTPHNALRFAYTKISVLDGILVFFFLVHLVKSYPKNLSRGELNVNLLNYCKITVITVSSPFQNGRRIVE